MERRTASNSTLESTDRRGPYALMHINNTCSPFPLPASFHDTRTGASSSQTQDQPPFPTTSAHRDDRDSLYSSDDAMIRSLQNEIFQLRTQMAALKIFSEMHYSSTSINVINIQEGGNLTVYAGHMAWNPMRQPEGSSCVVPADSTGLNPTTVEPQPQWAHGSQGVSSPRNGNAEFTSRMEYTPMTDLGSPNAHHGDMEGVITSTQTGVEQTGVVASANPIADRPASSGGTSTRVLPNSRGHPHNCDCHECTTEQTL